MKSAVFAKYGICRHYRILAGAIITGCFLFPEILVAQDTISTAQKLKVNGYLSDMQSVMFSDVNDEWINDILIHNRMNFSYEPFNGFIAAIEFRNRLMAGRTLELSPGSKKNYEMDNGLIPIQWNVSGGRSYLLNTSVDRAYIDYTINKMNIRAGRQRINWGQCFAFNPNDIFNTYSFFDFDYTERPGSDAVRLQYYGSAASTAELAASADSAGKITAAGLYRFNLSGYDFQIIAGSVHEQDYVVGIGWSGNIRQMGFRGEASYFLAHKNFSNTSGVLVAAAGIDYSFSNSISLQLEVLYNQLPNGYGIKSFQQFYGLPLSAKTLSFTPWNFLLSASYPLTPLINTGLSGIYYPELNGFYLGPNIGYSLKDNVDLSFYYQYFHGEIKQQVSSQSFSNSFDFNLAFLRLKWSF